MPPPSPQQQTMLPKPQYDGTTTIIAVNAIMSALAIVAVTLRLIARKGQRLHADDGLILLAVILTVAICMAGIAAAAQGALGPSIAVTTPERYRLFRLELFVDVLLCHLIYGIIKLSVLLLYRRIFTTRWFRIVADVLSGITIVWMITVFIANLSACKPLNRFWDTPLAEGDAYIYDFQGFLIANGALDVVLDLIIVSMPLPVIRRLQISTGRKTSVAVIFMLGFFCLISSIVRLYYIVQVNTVNPLTTPPDRVTYEDTSVDLWAHIEACASIFTACLPTLGPLFREGSTLHSMLRSTRRRTDRIFLGSQHSSKSLPSDGEPTHGHPYSHPADTLRTYDAHELSSLNTSITKKTVIHVQNQPGRPVYGQAMDQK